jgi:hypothetical protein
MLCGIPWHGVQLDSCEQHDSIGQHTGKSCEKARLGGLEIRDLPASGHCAPRAGGTNRERRKVKAQQHRLLLVAGEQK